MAARAPGSLADAVAMAHAALAGGGELIWPPQSGGGDLTAPVEAEARSETHRHDAATRAAIAGLARSLRIEEPGRVPALAAPPRPPLPRRPGHPLVGLAVLTGAASGIGRCLALALAAEGMEVLAIDRDPALAALAAEAPRGIEVHIGDLCEMTRLPGSRPIDLLVHCAGISSVGRFARQALQPQLDVVALNHEVPIRLTEEALTSGRLVGGVVLVSSLSHYVGYPGAAVYAATKDGLVGYADALRGGLGEGQVLTVFPGPTRTPHAARYAPPGARADRRMAPEAVASAIVGALRRGDPELVPGGGNRALAWVGGRLPRVAEWMMKRAILAPLDRIEQAPAGARA